MRALDVTALHAALGRVAAGEPLPAGALEALAVDARALARRVERLRLLDPEAAAAVTVHPVLEALAHGRPLPGARPAAAPAPVAAAPVAAAPLAAAPMAAAAVAVAG